MSFKKCIQAGVRDGRISQDRADEVIDLYNQLRKEYRANMSESAAAARASADATAAAKNQAKQRKRRTLLAAQTWREIESDLQKYTNGDVTFLGRAMNALLMNDDFSRNKFASVEQLRQAIRSDATSRMHEILTTYKRDIAGRTRNKASMRNMIREVFGEDTGDAAAREMATAWRETAEYLRQRFNAAGGSIPKRVDWGMPQNHSAVRVANVSPQEWVEFTFELLDRKKMVDQQTGLRMSDAELREALKEVYRTISTDGQAKAKPTRLSRGTSISGRHLEHRFLVFKNPDAWLEYQQRFGSPDPFDTMIGHIDVMAREIALMERLGPNPRSTITLLETTLDKAVADNPAAKKRAEGDKYFMRNMYDAIVGTLNAPVNTTVSTFMAGVRQLLQAAQLGSAALLAVGDFNTQRLTRAFNGLPQVGIIRQTLSELMRLPRGERAKAALRLGLDAEAYVSVAAGMMRTVGDISGPEITRRIADATMRVSLLTPFTTAGRHAFQRSLLGALAEAKGKAFSELPTRLRDALEGYRIGEAEWDIIRSSPMQEDGGVDYVSVRNIVDRADIDPALAQSVADRLLIMMNTETRYAVPTMSVREEVAFGAARPGSPIGEVFKSFSMYKSFAVALYNTHIVRAFNQPTMLGKSSYVASFFVGMTLMGALGVQLKEISKGRDPRPMDTMEFWGAAILSGGGLGIFGDFLFANTNRFGGGLTETVAGPVAGFANDVRNLTFGNLQQLVSGEDTNFGREMARFASRYTPLSSVWYIRAGLERIVFDQLLMWADPNAERRFRQLERRQQREYGNEYWWPRGEVAPARAPDISQAMPPAISQALGLGR